jgi:hypothetical protein
MCVSKLFLCLYKNQKRKDSLFAYLFINKINRKYKEEKEDDSVSFDLMFIQTG